MAHTKGPWIAIGTDPAEGGDWFWINAQPNPAMRGFIKNIGCVNGSQSNPEQQANARLISLAPEMLEELEVRASDLFMLHKAIDAGDPKAELLMRVDDMLRETKALIARARGDA